MRFVIFIIILLVPGIIFANFLSDEEIKKILIQHSIHEYLITQGICPCPYNKDKVGKLCEERSAWSRHDSDSPICFPTDITKKMLENYKKNKIFQNPSIKLKDSDSMGDTGDKGVKTSQ